MLDREGAWGIFYSVSSEEPDLNSLLDKISPEALGEFLKAIGTY
ncbi:hypothetical protein [Microcystis aeruginosa]|nr:hypothetical protein [Microcystis aeruginosa]